MNMYWIVDQRGLLLSTVVGRFRDDGHGRVYRRVWRWKKDQGREWSAETAAFLVSRLDPKASRGLRVVPAGTRQEET